MAGLMQSRKKRRQPTVENLEAEMDENQLARDRLTLVADVFLNNLISTKQIHRLSLVDWKSFRLVNREWHNAVTKLETKEDSILVHRQTCKDTDTTTEGSQTHLKYSLQAFLDFAGISNQSAESLGRFSFQNFQTFSLENWSLGEKGENQGNLESYLRFSKTFGEGIHHLRITNFQFEKGNEAFYNLVRSLAPNMETLEVVVAKEWVTPFDFLSPLYLKADVHLNLRRLEIHWRTTCVPLKFLFLLKFPNLKELTVKIRPRISAFDLIPSIRLMRSPRRNADALKLTHLDVIDTDTTLEGLVETDLPLKYLSLYVRRKITEDSFQYLLEHYAKQLKTLKLMRLHEQRCPPFKNFPFSANFANLRELELWGNMTDSLDFLLATPVLKLLRIDLYSYEKRDTFPEVNRVGHHFAMQGDLVQNSIQLLERDSFTIPTLEEFRIESVLEVESWKILAGWMPNLNDLEAALKNETFQLVCSQWINLSRLKLRFGSDVDDNGITGGLGIMPVPKPNITNLKYLESFELEGLCDQGRLSDKAAEQGFLHLKHLSSLRIHVSKLMSMEMETKLKKAITDVEICRREKHEKRYSDDGLVRRCHLCNKILV